MNKMKKKDFFIQNIYILLSVLLFILIFQQHFGMDFTTGDDSWFKQAANNGFLAYLLPRYLGWSSRLIIEVVLISMLQLPKIVFFVLDSLMFVLIYYSILKITDLKNDFIASVLLFILIIVFPIDYFSTAGWYATMINYSWPLAFGLYSLYLISKITNKQELSIYQKVVLFPSTIFAINQEQLCALFFGFLFILNIWYFYKNKHINKYLVVIFALSCVMLACHGLCPGNSIRKVKETNTFYPEYSSFNLIDKIVLGVTSTFSIMLRDSMIVPFVFNISLLYCGLIDKNKLTKIVSLIPICIWVALWLIVHVQQLSQVGILNKVSTCILKYGSNLPEIIYSKGLFCYLLLILVMIVLVIYLIYRTMDLKCFCYISVVFLASLCARFILGFSASIFASLNRTFINSLFLQMICILLVIRKNKPLLFKDKD